MKKVAIVITFHNSYVSKYEKLSIKHLVHYLGEFDKFLVLPAAIKRISFEIPLLKKIIRFPDEYFTSVPKYCELLNTKMFYEKFIN